MYNFSRSTNMVHFVSNEYKTWESLNRSLKNATGYRSLDCDWTGSLL